jgi:hypothetical protein
MACFLLVNSVGYTVYAHFCDNELKQASLIVDTGKSCCADEQETTKPSKQEDMSCCSEQDVHVVIKDQFVKSELSFSALTQPVLFINSIFKIEHLADFTQLTTHNSQLIIGNFSPPPDLNLLHSVFRI